MTDNLQKLADAIGVPRSELPLPENRKDAVSLLVRLQTAERALQSAADHAADREKPVLAEVLKLVRQLIETARREAMI